LAAGPVAPPRARSLPLERLIELVAAVVRGGRFERSAQLFSSRLARLVRAQRISLGLVVRRRVRLRSLSDAAFFDRRTNLVRTLEDAMVEAHDHRATLRCNVPGVDASAQDPIRRRHADLLRLRGGGSVLSVPVLVDAAVVAVLTLERDEAAGFSEAEQSLVEVAAQLAGPVLCLKERNDRRWSPRVRVACTRLLGRLLGRGHLAAKLAALAGAAVVLFLCLADGTHRVVATSHLEGSVVRAAVAPFDGFIAEAHTSAGDVVEAGATLCRLDDRDLRLEAQEWRSQVEKLKREHSRALARLETSELGILDARLAQTRAHLALVEARLQRTTVTADLAGVVVRGDLRQSIGAPVARGDVLYEIAPLEGYRAVLEVDEREAPAVRSGQAGTLALNALPSDPMRLRVRRVTPVASVREGRTYFRVEADLAEAPEIELRPGMEGVARIEIGSRRLVWIWTHKAAAWLRLQLWSWLP
jgi:biotin carboxyl carrier protein